MTRSTAAAECTIAPAIAALVLSVCFVCAPPGAVANTAAWENTASSPTLTLSRKPQPSVWKRMEIGGSITEAVSAMSLFGAPSITIKDIRDQLSKIASDDKVAGLILRINDPKTGFAKVEELHAAIGQLRQAGKKVVAILSSESATGYLIASACDRVIMAPSGVLMLTGMNAEAYFYKGLFDHVGVKGDFLAVGKFKSGAEAYTRSEWSEPAREAMESLVGDLFDQMVMMIAAGRGLEPKSVRNTIDLGPFTAEDALRFKLVDELAYEEDFLRELRDQSEDRVRVQEIKLRQEPETKPLNPLSLLGLFTGSGTKQQPASSAKTKIAIIYVVGMILPTQPESLFVPEDIVSPGTMKKYLRECLDDPTIRAIILRIDSPGGDATASDLIWKEVRRVRRQKPVIASMSDTAASGGYYIAMAADRIVAQPGTITGSIGVYGGKLVLGGLYDMLGIGTSSVTRGQNAALLSSTTGFNDSERAAFQRFLNKIYQEFTSKAAESRGLSEADLQAVAQGRVWTGRQAAKIGLVDELGGLETALALAKDLSGIPQDRAVEIKIFPEKLGILDLMQKLLNAQAMASRQGLDAVIPALLPDGIARIARSPALLKLLSSSRPLALMPFVLEFR